MAGFKRMRISKAVAAKDGQARIRGWIYRKRSSGGKLFVVIRDNSGTIQCVADKSAISAKEWEKADAAYLESAVEVAGTLKADARAPGGAELEVKSISVSNSKEQFPITEYQSPEFLLDVRHLWLRSARMSNIMKARSHLFRYAREFLDKQGFFEITPPLITKSGGETGADMFEVNYFGQKAYLTESSQLYAEAMIYSLEKVYSFAPSWRAEKSRTVKHLAEYWHLEPEMAYYNNAKSMALQERLVSHMAARLAKNDRDILEAVGADAAALEKIRPPFKRISYDKAMEILQQKGSHKVWGDDFGVEEEKLLTEDEEKPIFVHNMPKDLKAFYMPISKKDPRTVECADMLAPKGHGEIIGGSERIGDYDQMVARMKEKGLVLENYKWYLDTLKYGAVPHAGFGLGMERVIKWMLGLDHIRDAIPFPRVINRVEP